MVSPGTLAATPGQQRLIGGRALRPLPGLLLGRSQHRVVSRVAVQAGRLLLQSGQCHRRLALLQLAAGQQQAQFSVAWLRLQLARQPGQQRLQLAGRQAHVEERRLVEAAHAHQIVVGGHRCVARAMAGRVYRQQSRR